MGVMHPPTPTSTSTASDASASGPARLAASALARVLSVLLSVCLPLACTDSGNGNGSAGYQPAGSMTGGAGASNATGSGMTAGNNGAGMVGVDDGQQGGLGNFGGNAVADTTAGTGNATPAGGMNGSGGTPGAGGESTDAAGGTGGASTGGSGGGATDAAGGSDGEAVGDGAQAPTGLMTELLAQPDATTITAARPHLSWVVNDTRSNVVQTAYQILVASSEASLEAGTGDLWDSGQVESDQSIAVQYDGSQLPSDSDVYWSVRTWNGDSDPGPYSAPQHVRTGNVGGQRRLAYYPLVQTPVAPASVENTGGGRVLIDFGKAAFGTLEFTLPAGTPSGSIGVRLGEAANADGRVNMNPGSLGTSVVAFETNMMLREGTTTLSLQREVLPFRYVELTNVPFNLEPDHIRLLMRHYPFNDDAGAFESSDDVLNDVWEICKYSMKATSFMGRYVDGDRERLEYEADAYINQLGHYAVDREFSMARHTHEHLIDNATWPTEWILHSVLMAWADFMYTGHSDSMSARYDDLVAKTLSALARGDGLITISNMTSQIRQSIHAPNLDDIVDWPEAERDGHDMRSVNSVVNAFYYRTLVIMSEIATVLGNTSDAQMFADRADNVYQAFNSTFFNAGSGIYIDGDGSNHSSLHSNMFPLAFGLVPEDRVASVVDFIKSRGMACSVYGAQYLLEALYLADEGQAALDLMVARTTRSWAHMIYDVGTTITLEAWDARFKPNLDWNHAWGAAPANIIPRMLMGIEPIEPGFARMQIKPQPGSLTQASLDLPTIRGTVHADFTAEGGSFELNVTLPANTRARVLLPSLGGADEVVTVDGAQVNAQAEGDFLVIEDVGSGSHTFVRAP